MDPPYVDPDDSDIWHMFDVININEIEYAKDLNVNAFLHILLNRPLDAQIKLDMSKDNCMFYAQCYLIKEFDTNEEYREQFCNEASITYCSDGELCCGDYHIAMSIVAKKELQYGMN